MSYAKELESTAKSLVAPGKGILAADESTGTIKKRFDKIKVENTEDNRRNYREMLFTTKGCEEFVSGVILFDETLRQKASDGTPLAQILTSKGIIPGIKVDKGPTKLAGSADEQITDGLDGLRARLSSTAASARASPSGAPYSRSGTASPATFACSPTPTRSRAMQDCAWTRGWCRSSSPRS